MSFLFLALLYSCGVSRVLSSQQSAFKVLVALCIKTTSFFLLGFILVASHPCTCVRNGGDRIQMAGQNALVSLNVTGDTPGSVAHAHSRVFRTYNVRNRIEIEQEMSRAQTQSREPWAVTICRLHQGMLEKPEPWDTDGINRSLGWYEEDWEALGPSRKYLTRYIR